MMDNNELRDQKNLTSWILIVGLSVGLAMWFWLDLWLGGGLIGGDVYSYYFPQKTFFADSLQAGQPTDWNPLVGHGYSLIAESQTGVFYPPYQIAYRLWEVNEAYNFIHLFHYIVAFLAVVLLAKELGIGFAGAALSGLVFVYGWFAPRSCLEWAIVTGGYLPVVFWLLLRFLKTGKSVWLWALSFMICLQLLAGHYNLAFITLLSLVIWLSLQSVFCWKFSVAKNTPQVVEPGVEPSVTAAHAELATAPAVAAAPLCLKKLWALSGLAIGLALLMASLQLLPTWELKQVSQRSSVDSSQDFSVGEGHIPPWYLSQIVMPWYWYSEPAQLDQKLNQPGGLAIQAGTNKVEAHLYFGLIPLLLAGMGAWGFVKKRSFVGDDLQRRSLLILGVLGAFGLIYAFGWLLFLADFLPGFGFFRGPGRYGILTSLAVAVWAGLGWEVLKARLTSKFRGLVWASLFFLTLLDLSWVSQQITYSWMVAQPAIHQREESEIRKMLLDRLPPARLFAPGPNAVTITGIASTPVYLGIGPSAYFEPSLTFPEDQSANPSEGKFTPEQIEWLRRAGVTHVLGFGPPSPENSELTLIWSGVDLLLNPLWGRPEPLYLSELSKTRERADWLPEISPETTSERLEQNESLNSDLDTEQNSSSNLAEAVSKQPPRKLVEPTLTWKDYQPHRQSLTVATPIERTLIMTDLYDPAWKVTINGEAQTALKLEGMYRGVRVPAGIHQVDWQYSPDSYVHYQRVSIAGFTIWLLWGILLFVLRKKDASCLLGKG